MIRNGLMNGENIACFHHSLTKGKIKVSLQNFDVWFMKIDSEQVAFYVFIIVYFCLAGYCGFKVYQTKEHLLLVEKNRQTTMAIITRCASSVNTTSIYYEFQVTDERGHIRTIEGHNFGGGSVSAGCKVGDEIMVEYSKKNPNVSFHGRQHQDLFTHMLGLIICGGMVIYMFGVKLSVFSLPRKR